MKEHEKNSQTKSDMGMSQSDEDDELNSINE